MRQRLTCYVFTKFDIFQKYYWFQIHQKMTPQFMQIEKGKLRENRIENFLSFFSSLSHVYVATIIHENSHIWWNSQIMDLKICRKFSIYCRTINNRRTKEWKLNIFQNIFTECKFHSIRKCLWITKSMTLIDMRF